MPETFTLHDLISELRDSDPNWNGSLARFRAYQRTQAIDYARRDRQTNRASQRRECLCGAPIVMRDDGSERVDLDGRPHHCRWHRIPERPPVHPETAHQLAQGFARTLKIKAAPQQPEPTSKMGHLDDELR